MINLLPSEFKRDVKFAKYNVILVQYIFVIGALILIMLSLVVFGRITLTGTKGNIEDALKADRVRFAELASVNEVASEYAQTIDTITSLLNSEVRFSLLLQEIGSVMPPGVHVTALDLSTDNSLPIRLSVELTSAEKAGVLQENITESCLFVGADILSVSQANGEVYGFAGDLQAYYDQTIPLYLLGDQEAYDVACGVTEEAPADDSQQTQPTDDQSSQEESVEETEQTTEDDESTSPENQDPEEGGGESGGDNS